MSDDLVKLAVVAPTAAIQWIKRSAIAMCVLRRSEPSHVVVRLTDGSTLVATKASVERAGLFSASNPNFCGN